LVENNRVSTVVLKSKKLSRDCPSGKKFKLRAGWQTQVSDRLSDDEMMEIAAEGARALDRREAQYAKRKAR
jgi:hypothetical protein